MTIGVSELQKDIGIIRNLGETLYIIDKKTNEVLATVFPNKKMPQESITQKLGGVFANSKLEEKYQDKVEDAISDAYEAEMLEKYGTAHAR
ncbi:MAG: hypothetical protein Q9M36_12500 [Sulfurovum sp.]|nr:hypothetical protein [Sulfurovum sp.]